MAKTMIYICRACDVPIIVTAFPDGTYRYLCPVCHITAHIENHPVEVVNG